MLYVFSTYSQCTLTFLLSVRLSLWIAQILTGISRAVLTPACSLSLLFACHILTHHTARVTCPFHCDVRSSNWWSLAGSDLLTRREAMWKEELNGSTGCYAGAECTLSACSVYSALGFISFASAPDFSIHVPGRRVARCSRNCAQCKPYDTLRSPSLGPSQINSVRVQQYSLIHIISLTTATVKDSEMMIVRR